MKRICVLDRTKEPGANGEPLYLDVKDALDELGLKDLLVVGGRYGLGSNDTTPAQMLAVFENLALPQPKNHFTVGINDDLTFTSLPVGEEIAMGDASLFQAKFYGLGADGTVGANKNSVKIIGDTTDKYCQAVRNPVDSPARTSVSATSLSTRPISLPRLTSWLATFRLTSTCTM